MSYELPSDLRHKVEKLTDTWNLGPRGVDYLTSSRKRALDASFATSGLITCGVLSPILLPVLAAVYLEDKGWPFVDIGKVPEGIDFPRTHVWKIRTMHPWAAMSEKYMVDAARKINPEATMTSIKENGDDRITKIGKVLRKLSADEIAQFGNIFLGDMSAVGPKWLTETQWRDEVWPNRDVYPYKDYLELIEAGMKVGITGVHGLFGRSKLGLWERVALEVEYARQSNICSDMMVLLKTPAALLSLDGAK